MFSSYLSVMRLDARRAPLGIFSEERASNGLDTSLKGLPPADHAQGAMGGQQRLST